MNGNRKGWFFSDAERSEDNLQRFEAGRILMWGGLVTLVVACLHLVIQKLQAHPVRPPPLPEGDKADPDPVRLDVITEPVAVQQLAGDFLGRQRA